MLSPPPPPNDIAPGQRPRVGVGDADRPDPSSPARAEADALLHDANVPPHAVARVYAKGGGRLAHAPLYSAARALSGASAYTFARAPKKKGRTERARTRRQAVRRKHPPPVGGGAGVRACAALRAGRAYARGRGLCRARGRERGRGVRGVCEGESARRAGRRSPRRARAAAQAVSRCGLRQLCCGEWPSLPGGSSSSFGVATLSARPARGDPFGCAPRDGAGGRLLPRARHHAAATFWVSCRRLPHVSSMCAMMTGPALTGPTLMVTSRALRNARVLSISPTMKVAHGMPSA